MTRDDSAFDGLLLDFGGVCLLNPVELHARAETTLGLEPGTLRWLGPLRPDTDPLWQELVSGEGLSEREYWARRAAEVGQAAGWELDTRGYMDILYHPPSDDLVRPEAVRVVEAAQAAGFQVSVLTNDLRAFHGREWEYGISFLQLVDHIVDCSDTGILKPDPRAYKRAVETMGLEPDRILFVDDQPPNIDGAEAFGLPSHWFDIANATESWAEVGRRLGLSE